MIRFLSVFSFAFKMAAKRDRRAIPPVDYVALEAGLSPGLKGSNKSVKTASADTSPVQQDCKPSVASFLVPPTSLPVPTDPTESLSSALEAARAEHAELLRTSELRDLQRELSSLQQQNARLRGQLEDPPLKASSSLPPSLTVQDIRAIPGLSSRVDTKLQQLGLSDSSGSEDSADDEDGKRRDRAKRGKKLRSGKTAKITSRVLHPQVWPQSQLSLAYISKEVAYDNLTLAEFAAGFASILRLPSLSAEERDARTDHFATLMYLATQFSWPAVRSLHAAVLFEIECGRLRWGDSFAHLEARLLHGHANQPRSSNASVLRQNATVQFCKAFQTGKCTFTKDHYGQIRNERKWVQHICAKCWLTKQEVERHPENSPECPFASSSSNTSTSQTTRGSFIS